VPLKYDGLDGTEIALSESQERMAVVVSPADAAAFRAAAARENLECVLVADVTDTGRLVMEWRGQRVVDIARDFLDSNGVRQTAAARVAAHRGAVFLKGSRSFALERCLPAALRAALSFH